MSKKQDRDEEKLQDTQTVEELPEQESAQETQETSPLEELQQEFASLNERYLRTLAEYDNYRKRSSKERDSIYPEAKASVLTGLLAVMDNFSRAMETPCSDSEFKKGVEMIYHSFQEALSKQGVEELGTVGEPFDPNCHNAVMHVQDEEFGENAVCEVFQKGYRMGDRILRCAMVKVAN